MPLDWKPAPKGGWKLLDESGALLDTLCIDWASLQYRDSRGILLGRRWEDARGACEARHSGKKAGGRR